MADHSRSDGRLGLFLDVDAFFFFFFHILMEFLAGEILLYYTLGCMYNTIHTVTQVLLHKWIIPELCSLCIHSSSQALILTTYTSLQVMMALSTPHFNQHSLDYLLPPPPHTSPPKNLGM